MHSWVKSSIRKISADFQRSADTHLIRLELPLLPGIDIYLKDESTHPTGSLKHRLARSLFLYGLCNGNIGENTTLVESSSGSTAVSEAYFARMIGVPFMAVMPRCTARSKIQQIEFYGGQCHYVDYARDMCEQSRLVAESVNGYFMDQFTYAERATDWRGNNNIADSIFRQMQEERYPIPKYIVMSAGTGGTSATIGRYIRYKGYDTDLVVVDPENSVFYDSFTLGDPTLTASYSSRIEGIGRPQIEASFLPQVIDQMIKVPDAASIAAIHWLEKLTGKKAGGSTGTNLWGVIQVARIMCERGQSGSIVSLMCDGGDRYLDTYYNPEWVQSNIGDIRPYLNELNQFL